MAKVAFVPVLGKRQSSEPARARLLGLWWGYDNSVHHPLQGPAPIARLATGPIYQVLLTERVMAVRCSLDERPDNAYLLLRYYQCFRRASHGGADSSSHPPMTSLEFSDRLRRIRIPAYFILSLAVVVPLTELIVSVSPPHFDNVVWRFGMMGVAASALGTPLSGLLFLCIMGLLSGDRGVVRTVAIVSAIIAAVAIIGSGNFVLDVLQMKAKVRPEALPRFKYASGSAFVKLILEAIGSTLLSIGAFRSVRGARSEKVRSPRESLLVGTPTVKSGPPSTTADQLSANTLG